MRKQCNFRRHANYGHAPYHVVTEAHDLGVTCAQFAPVFSEVDDIDKSKGNKKFKALRVLLL